MSGLQQVLGIGGTRLVHGALGDVQKSVLKRLGLQVSSNFETEVGIAHFLIFDSLGDGIFPLDDELSEYRKMEHRLLRRDYTPLKGSPRIYPRIYAPSSTKIKMKKN